MSKTAIPNNLNFGLSVDKDKKINIEWLQLFDLMIVKVSKMSLLGYFFERLLPF